jgi:hypothetical protein
MLRVVKVACSNTLTTSRTMASTSWEGTARIGADSEEGFNCMMSMFASASQTAVSWRRAAPHTSSSRGAGGNEIKVASAERAVTDLKRSLSAYHRFAWNPRSHNTKSQQTVRRTSLIPASVDQSSTAPWIACSICSLSCTIRISSLAYCMRSTSSAAGEASKPVASVVRVRPLATPDSV